MNLQDQADRDASLAVPCAYCHAEAGAVCVRLGTTVELVNAPAHTPRLRDAGVIHAPIDSRELRSG